MTMSKIALVAALVLGAASGAYAGGKDDPDSSGGYRVGPLGQSFDSGVNPTYHRSLHGAAQYRGAYARAPQHQSQ